MLGDQLHVTNLTTKPVEIFDGAGKPFIRIPTGANRTWHDPRVVGSGDPPPATAAAYFVGRSRP